MQKKTYTEQMSPEDLNPLLHINSNGVITNAGKPIDDVVKQGLRTNSQPEGATETVSGLDWGVYYFLEVKAPEGYQVNNKPQRFKVDAASSDATIEVNMSDEKIYGEVWLYKQDKDPIATGSTEHEKLFGAQFELYDSTNSKVLSVPRLRIGGLTDSTINGVSNRRKEFIVKSFRVTNKDTIEFTIVDDTGDTYTVTVDYLITGENQSKGKVGTVTVDEEEFKTKYGDGTYSADDLRLAYYAMTANKSQIYDDSQKKYRQPTDLERQYASDTYVTANEGGRLNVRGLDWDSYYFHETVPPVGYSLSEDVIFSVNSFNCGNQFIKCEDPKKQAEIIIDKEIPNKDYFKAYGEPTFLFKVHKLKTAVAGDTADFTKDSTDYVKTGKNYTLAIHMSETTGSAMLSVPEGQYLIEELPVSRYTCTGLELVPGTDENKAVKADMKTSPLVGTEAKHTIDTNNFIAFCDLTGSSNQSEILTFRVKYKNEIKRYDNFSEVTFADNRIPGETYVTSFKPIYEPLVTADKYYSDSTGNYYEIDLSKALTDKEFMAKIVYNNGVSEDLDLGHIDNMKFRDNYDNLPFDHATFGQYDGTGDYFLKLKFKDNFDSSSVAGQTISFDVGYGKNGLEAYDTNNTGMIRGTLNLTFDETPSDIRKRVVFKTDANNRSIFNLPAGDGIEQLTAAEMVYTKAADTGSVTSEPTAFTDLTVLAEGYVFKYWYLLGDDGRPVADKDGNIVQFGDEAAVRAYIFGSTAPEGVTLPTGSIFNHPDKVNGFTFQAEVEESKERPLTARFVLKTNTDFLTLISSSSTISSDSITLSKGNMTGFKEGDQSGWEAAGEGNRLTYDSYGGSYTEGDPYPDKIRFYNIGTDVFWYTVDRETLEPSKGSVYVEFESNYYKNTSNLFNNYTKLEDVSGMFDWDLSGVTMLGYIFQNTKITEFTLNRTYKASGYMYMSRMFYDCKHLTTVTMNIDTSDAPYGDCVPGTDNTYKSAQTKQMFCNCKQLVNLNLSGDFSNLFNAKEMFKECSSLTASEFKRAFSTWIWNTNNNDSMQTGGNNYGDQIFMNNSSLASALAGVDLVDANGNHFKRKDNIIVSADYL